MRRNPAIYLLAAVLFLSLALPASCFSGRSSDRETASSNQFSAPNGILPDFASLVAGVEASVVAITTEIVSYDSLNVAYTEVGAGSGWVYDRDGTIVTNSHVVEGAKNVFVQFSDGRVYIADDVITDPLTDIATLRVRRERSFRMQPLPIADSSSIRVGDWVLVMGNPLGMGISAKQGIISRLGVAMTSSPEAVYTNLIETSAAINPGNSGGPMLNLNGEVIGITTLKIDASGVEGMGYAITAQDVVPIIDVLASGQPFPRAYLGASLADVDRNVSARYSLFSGTGALVVDICPGSPAEKSRLTEGDLITTFEGTPIVSAEQLNRLIKLSDVGQKVKLTFWRGDQQRTADAVLENIPPTDACPVFIPNP